MNQELQKLLEINNISNDDVEKVLHETFRLFVLEEVCKKIKYDEEFRIGVLNKYYKDKNNERVTKRIVYDICGINLPDNDLKWLNGCILAFFKKRDKRLEIPEKEKKKLLIKQKYICPCCGNQINLDNSHYDHIVPWDYVGDELNDNGQMLCAYCNSHKSSNSYYLLKRLIIKNNI